MVFEEIWRMVKTTAPYQISGYKTIEQVVKSEPMFSFDHYNPTDIPRSSNLVVAEERIHFRVREQPRSRISVQNVDDNEEEEV
jgi:hypothetical protein